MQEWFSWQRCKAFAERIYANDRWFSNDRFQKTAEYCASVMREARLSQVELLGLKADGRSAYGDWVIARAWNAKNATLRLVDDGTVLADYQAAPCALALQSAPTPPEGVCAEAVWVQRAEEIPDVREKILFTGLPAKELVRAAQQGGALGIVTDYMPLFPGVRDSRESMRGVNRWDNDFCLPKNDTGLFAFSLAPEMGELLRNRLASEEKVRLFAQVDTEERDGMLPSISGCIPGSDPECGEIFVYGHLYEPGANDNASGTAVMTALAKRLSDTPTEHNIIFIAFGGEEKGCLGSMNFVTRMPFQKKDITEMINLDMTGRADSDTLYFRQSNNTSISPTEIPSGTLVLTGGEGALSDHLDFSAAGIATSFFTTGEDPLIHTTEDTSDRLDYGSLDRITDFLADYILAIDKAGS